jgi:fluoroquinolone transport system ATP-binding protein
MITVDGLRFSYPGSHIEALKGIGFSVSPGEVFGFLGPSGAGKSTTQNILIGLLKRYHGSVRVAGRELREVGSDYYEEIGVAFEYPNFYGRFTALENLTYFQSLFRRKTTRPEALLEVFGLGSDKDTRVAAFSKGMKTRLNLCRAFLNSPGVVFLDEPTTGLDPGNAQRVIEIIREKQRQGTTIFLTTHNMHVADVLCDRVAFIVDGRIDLVDSPRELKVGHGKKTVKVEYRTDGRLESREFSLVDLANDTGFLSLLKEGGVETIHTQEATLEDIFIRVTGRKLS